MRAFGVALTDTQIVALTKVVASFSPTLFEQPAVPVKYGKSHQSTIELVARGSHIWERSCLRCHGATGKGDGPLAANLTDVSGAPSQMYDLTARPLRRPGNDSIETIFKSIFTGLHSTPCGPFAGSVPDDDLWAASAFVDSIRYRQGPHSPTQPEPTSVDLLAIWASRPLRLPAGYWPGDPTSPDARVWGAVLESQGKPPQVLTPAQASLAPNQCGRCHAKQLSEWRGSYHAMAASPGFIGQVIRENNPGQAEACQRCHAPLAEQHVTIRPKQFGGRNPADVYIHNPIYDASLHNEGVACAVCHLRKWQRLGPPRIPDSRLLPQAGYPMTELPIYERSDFCLPCHQLPPRKAVLEVHGSKEDRSKRKPLLNTYREWLEGPYMPRGIQCQHCHMPNREHTLLGVHDPETFRQGIKLEATIARSKRTDAIGVYARVTNIGAGHYLPTNPTPAAWLTIELLDFKQQPIKYADSKLRIGRYLKPKGEIFEEIEDTRIPPEKSVELEREWSNSQVGKAKFVRVSVRVEPDELYERVFTGRLKQNLSKEVRAYFETALKRTKESKYIAVEKIIPIP
jgi:hypothetical protein